MEFTVESKKKDDFVDITAQIQDAVRDSKVKDGVCVVFVPHTTAAIAVNENADPDVRSDIKFALNTIVTDPGFKHAEGNASGHVKSTIIGCSASFVVEGSKLRLGSWQGIFLCDFDGPRTRKVWVKVVPS
jgi:secondary thiamine-phosphate synthase enzyme